MAGGGGVVGAMCVTAGVVFFVVSFLVLQLLYV